MAVFLRGSLIPWEKRNKEATMCSSGAHRVLRPVQSSRVVTSFCRLEIIDICTAWKQMLENLEIVPISQGKYRQLLRQTDLQISAVSQTTCIPDTTHHRAPEVSVVRTGVRAPCWPAYSAEGTALGDRGRPPWSLLMCSFPLWHRRWCRLANVPWCSVDLIIRSRFWWGLTGRSGF